MIKRLKMLSVVLLVILVANFIVVPIPVEATPSVVTMKGEMIQGRLLVPMREIFEALGAGVTWDGNTKIITGKKGNTTVSLTIDSNTAKVNNNTIKLDVPATVVKGKTYVPLRFISEALEASVHWDGNNKVAEITAPGKKIFISESANLFYRLDVLVTDEKVVNKGNYKTYYNVETLLSVRLAHVWYRIDTKKTLISTDSVIGINKNESKSYEISKPYGEPDTNLVYLGTIIAGVNTYRDESFNNPNYQNDLNYISSPELIKQKVDEYNRQIEAGKKALANELKANNNVPIKIERVEVGYNIIDTPEVTLYIRNLTPKTIIAYEISFQCYDSYDRPVNRLFSKTNLFEGISQNDRIASGERDSATWNLTLYDLTTKVKNVRIVSVRFSDGTTWRR